MRKNCLTMEAWLQELKTASKWQILPMPEFKAPELLYYCKVLYFLLGLLRVLQSVRRFMASVFSGSTCVLKCTGALNGWPRKSVHIERWESLNKVLILTSLVYATRAPVMNKSWTLQGPLSRPKLQCTAAEIKWNKTWRCSVLMVTAYVASLHRYYW